MEHVGGSNLRIKGTIAVALSVMLFGVPVVPRGEAAEPASIQFLNPSSFADGGAGIVVSDRAAARPRAGTEGYRISAWVKNAPEDAGVEFELLNNGVSLDTLDAVSEIGPDTFGYSWNIPDTLPDGPYTLRATLFSGNESVDHVDADVTILRLGDRATVDYPTVDVPMAGWPGNGTFGTFRPLAAALPDEGIAQRAKPVGNVESSHTTGSDITGGTTRVRAFYTTSQPGSVPKWNACGTEKTPGHPVPSSAANNGIRCTLSAARDQTRVTAVAVVANSSPGEYDPAANQAGDAVRVLHAYAQKPTDLDFLSGAGDVLDENVNGGFPCHTMMTHVEDQIGREVLAANIDVHAVGPSDKLRMDTGLLPVSGIKHPDRHHTLTEPGHDCFGDNQQGAGAQGEHQTFGAPDPKHVEADLAGTDDNGNWGFSFKVPADQVSTERFTVSVSASVDETDDGCHANDDRLTHGELLETAAVGLGRAPAGPAAPVISSPERCDRLPALRALTLKAGRGRVPEGKKVGFWGVIKGTRPACADRQPVLLKAARKPTAQRFRTVARMRTTASGNYSFGRVRIERTRYYRTIAPRSPACARAVSGVVKVTALG